ncbi:MAG TPA: DUF4340 domain-containing protein [Stellaceae bacterium]|nr:DUF4340 domain-containing protein [Stellaceae bacterium]
MKSKGLVALLLVTTAAVIVAVLGSLGGDGNGGRADPKVDQPVLPVLAQHLPDAARVSLVHGANKTTLVRAEGKWVVEEKSNYPANMAEVTQVLVGLADLHYVEPKTQKPDLYPRLEVEDAGKPDGKSTLVTVSDPKGQPLGEIIAGKEGIDQLGGGSDGIYIRMPGDAQAWLARGTVKLPEDTNGWLDRSIVDVPRETVREVVLTQPDGNKLDIARDKPDDKLALKDAPAETKLKSDTVLVEPTTALASLTLSDVRPAAEIPSDGAVHGEVSTFDGLTVAFTLVDKDGKSWIHLEASGTGDAAKKADTLNLKLKPWAYAIPDYKAKILRTKLADVIAVPKPS